MAMPGPAGKSPEAFRTIGEVAAELDLPQHVLRFWESKFAAIKPLKRGGGRRYYRPDDLDLLRGIRALLYREGLTIKGVQKIFRERGARYVMELGRGATGPIAQPDAAPDPRPEQAAAVQAEDAGEPGYGLTEDERGRFSSLLDELVELKTRLKSARRVAKLAG